MKYNLESKQYTNVFDVVRYTAMAMKESGFSADDIACYIELAIHGNNYNLISVSQSQLEECNSLNENTPSRRYWNDELYDYSGLLDEYSDDAYDDLEDSYEGFSSEYSWDEEADDDYDEDEDCYEGFDCCKRKYYCDCDDEWPEY